MFYPLNPDIAKTLHGIKKKMIFFCGRSGCGASGAWREGRRILSRTAAILLRRPGVNGKADSSVTLPGLHP